MHLTVHSGDFLAPVEFLIFFFPFNYPHNAEFPCIVDVRKVNHRKPALSNVGYTLIRLQLNLSLDFIKNTVEMYRITSGFIR